MEDSIEDFIRITRNVKEEPKEPKVKISNELLMTAQRKKECEAHAIKIVEFLIEGKLRPEIFLRCLKYISQEHYQDIVEERAISRLCGYSLCGKKIPIMPKQKYVISTKANKIFEITDRKNYCSNFCYKASIHIKQQIEISPLWLRNFNESPNFVLLPSNEIGSPGIEIDQGLAKPEVEAPFTSIAQFAEHSLHEAGELEKISKDEKGKKVKLKKRSNVKPPMNTINENDVVESKGDKAFATDVDATSKLKNEGEISNSKCSDNVGKNQGNEAAQVVDCDASETETKKSNSSIKIKGKSKKANEADKLNYLINKLKINKEPKTKLVEPAPLQRLKSNQISLDGKPVTISDKIVTNAHNSNKPRITTAEQLKALHANEVLNVVRKCMKDWLTLETYIHIYGVDKIKEILNEKKLDGYFDKLKVVELQTTQQLKYMGICKRLQVQEMAEEKFDCALTGRKLKPLPDYRKLKEENRELDIKVKSFYDGVLHEQPDKNFPTKPVKENAEDGAPSVLPLVDLTAQTALRRKVFLNSINRILQRLTNELNLDGSKVLLDVQDLVKTFKLEAHNIIFKPTTWNLIAVILMNMLSLRDENIKNQLLTERSVEHINLLLSPFPDIDGFMKELFCMIEDIDVFIEYYVTHV